MTRGTILADIEPANCWQDAFPVGNGRHGALVPGQPGTEQVIVTHSRLTWPDTADAPDGPPELAGRLDEARDLLLTGKSHQALALFGSDWPQQHPRPFHPAFAVSLTGHGPAGPLPSGYRRTLNYRAGVAVTRWPGRRTVCFASRVRDVVVQHIRGDTASGDTAWDAAVSVDLRLPGAPAGLQVTTELRQFSDIDAAIVVTVAYPDSGNGTEGGARGMGGYVGVVRVLFPGAISVPDCHGIRLVGCRELTLLTRVELFDGADSGDSGVGEAARNAARDRALAAVTAAPGELRLLLAEHARAHAAAFGDVALDLGVPAAERRLPVGELLDRQAAQPKAPLPALLEKLFDSGRYLLLSASGPLPSRLPGIWQGDWNSAWSGAITTNANLPLQLAGAVSTDIPAAVDAVANLIADQLDDWRVNARRLFGTRGIVAPAHTDGISGRNTHFLPGWPHQLWTAGADWLLVPVLDEELARGATGNVAARAAGRSQSWIGTVLLELAAFYEDFLSRRDADGKVVFAPSYSPENAPDGWAPMALNATMDIAAARHALRAAVAAVPEGHEAVHFWLEILDRLPRYRLTPDGALAEWAWPPEGSGAPPLPANDDHRHVSHLYPVWPLHEITVAGTPELAAAALKALRARGAQDDSAHGYLHKALVAARLRDADLAGQLLAALTAQEFFFRSLMSSHYPKRSVYNADAACALPGLLAEMLVDSVPAGKTSPGRVELLPAVPEFLPRGLVRGLRTLTGARLVSLRWDAADGTAEAVLESAAGGEVEVSCWGSDRSRRVLLPAGDQVRLSWEGTACEALR
jgi:alpha-L-fucosidase 2